MKINIREVNREWAVDLETPDKIQSIYFKSRQNALSFVKYLELADNVIKLDKKELQTPMTNYDRIKAKIANMTVDEISEFLSKSRFCENFCAFTKNGICNSHGSPRTVCNKGIKQWLESEVEGE